MARENKKEQSLPESVDIEPNWPNMFRFAVEVTKTNLPKNKGRDLVVEMLEFGLRIYHFREDYLLGQRKLKKLKKEKNA